MSDDEGQRLLVTRLHSVFLFGVPIITFYWIQAIAMGYPTATWLTSFTLLILALAYGIKKRLHRPVVASWILLTGLLVFLTGSAMIDGQHHSKVLWIMSLVPLLASHLLGSASMKLSAVFSFAALIFVWISPNFFVVTPEYPVSRMDELVLQLTSLTFAVGVVLSLKRSTQLHTAKLRLQGEDLDRARQQAESASRAKSAFLANMSQELRIPMNGILGLTQRLKHSKLKAEDAQNMELAHKSGQKLLDMVNDILDFSKIQAGELHLVERTFELNTALQAVADRHRAHAQKQKVKLHLELPQAPEYLSGDVHRVQQIVGNLLDNAIKFSPHAEVWLRAKCAVAEPGGDQDSRIVQISVQDTGRGISAADQARLFLEFEQINRDLEDEQTGTGLGLVLVRHLVEQMDGEIAVQSEVGQGSTFQLKLRLPLALSNAAPQKALVTAS